MEDQAQAKQPETEQGKYVYCIIKTDIPRDFGPVGIGGRGDKVYTVPYKEFAAVVSNCPLIVFDPTRENALAHEHVNELVMKDFTVLPMSFGTVFRTENDIKEFLKGTYDALSDVLQKMDGKIEFGLKVNWDKDQVVHEIETENEEIRRLKEEISRIRRRRPTSRACSSAAWSSRRCRRRRMRTSARFTKRCATPPSRRGRTNRSATR